MLSNYFMLLLSSTDFFQNYLFPNIISWTLSESQTVWIHIQGGRSVGAYLGPYCLQRFVADDKSRG